MKKILVIEDDPVMAHVCQRLLTKHEFEVEVANDGAKGLERVSAFQPDLVLLDLMMPKTNGIEVLNRIRAQDAYRNLPIIVFTNACVPALIEQAKAAGATRILDKSKFNPVTLTELLRGLLDVGPVARLGVVSQNEPVKRLN
jgi:CheY-like chemotaxis protein